MAGDKQLVGTGGVHDRRYVVGDLGSGLLIGLAAAIGTIAGGFLKELLPSLALEDWKRKRQVDAVFRRYRDPLVLSATELIHRLEEVEREYPPQFLRLAVKSLLADTPTDNSDTDAYYQRYKLESSIYRLCAFLGWLELYRQDLVFLDSGERIRNTNVEAVLKRVRSILGDGHLNAAQDWEEWSDALIFREEQRAIGERMIAVRRESRTVVGYAAFCELYRSGVEATWFSIAERFLLDLREIMDFRRTRIRLVTMGLIDLVEVLDAGRVNQRLASLRDRLRSLTPAK